MVKKPLIAQGYTLAEEIANSISHGIGLVFGIVGLVLLLGQAFDTHASTLAITSYALYGGSMILLFRASTLYHSISQLRAVGGLIYSLGGIFYVCKRIPYNHAIWHGFVLGGSVCHFLAIYLYVGQI